MKSIATVVTVLALLGGVLGADLFYFLDQDPRLCSFPYCGGFFLTPVNGGNPDGSRTYVSTINGANDSVNFKTLGHHTIVQGALSNDTHIATLNLTNPDAVFEHMKYNVTGVNGVDVTLQTLYLVGYTFIQCPRFPVCPTFIASKLNADSNVIESSVLIFNDFDVDYTKINATDESKFIEAMRQKSLIAAGEFSIFTSTDGVTETTTLTPQFFFIPKAQASA